MSEKLGALCAAVVLLPMIVASVVVVMKVSTLWQDQASVQLQSDARMAAGLYEKRLAELRSAAQKLALDLAAKLVISSDDPESNRSAARAQIQDLLPSAQRELSLDFIIVADPAGRVMVRHNDQPAPGETLLGSDKNPLAERVISDAKSQRVVAAASSVIEKGERLKRLNLDLRAKIDRADGTLVEDAMMMEAAAPVFRDGKFLGVVLIGQLINNSFSPRVGENALQLPLQVEARQTIYGSEDAGAVIALSDTIIASSMSDAAGDDREAPLVGLRRDPAKEDQVFENAGRSYAVRFQTLKAIDGLDVGAIGVAIPTTRLEEAVATVRTTMIILTALASLVAGAAGYLFGRRLAQRVQSLSEAASRMSVGELSRGVEDPVGANSSRLARDEVTRLAERMDEMRESFRQAIERMRKR
ncbi:MAG: cache domain-containing protein [Acidobacteriota bacterium]